MVLPRLQASTQTLVTVTAENGHGLGCIWCTCWHAAYSALEPTWRSSSPVCAARQSEMEAGRALLSVNQELMEPFLFCGCASGRLRSQNGSYLHVEHIEPLGCPDASSTYGCTEPQESPSQQMMGQAVLMCGMLPGHREGGRVLAWDAGAKQSKSFAYGPGSGA